jgi:hypothetical protein
LSTRTDGRDLGKQGRVVARTGTDRAADTGRRTTGRSANGGRTGDVLFRSGRV